MFPRRRAAARIRHDVRTKPAFPGCAALFDICPSGDNAPTQGHPARQTITAIEQRRRRGYGPQAPPVPRFARTGAGGALRA
ncbi:hypothetical protein AL037_20735 [Salipiger aestuarii]|nr:hypothetical protein AL037_20735 [Salipiger aestuarii]